MKYLDMVVWNVCIYLYPMHAFNLLWRSRSSRAQAEGTVNYYRFKFEKVAILSQHLATWNFILQFHGKN